MAKARLLGQVVLTSRKINRISDGAENLYYRILVLVDDFGRYYADVDILKSRCYPKKKISVSLVKKRLFELFNCGSPLGDSGKKKTGLIKLYRNDEEIYLELTSFAHHQKFRSDIKRREEFPKPVTYLSEFVTDCTEPVRIVELPSSTTNNNKNENNNNKKGQKANKGLRKRIIDYFNETTEQKRSYTCDETNKLINGRLDEGKTLKDFKHVIDTKTAQWFNDLKMRIFIRPSTLFRPGNFEDYLNEPYVDPKKIAKTGQVGVSRHKHKTKYNSEFLHKVYALLRKQKKDGNKYADLIFALTDTEAKAAAEKYKDNPAGFIKMLEENA